MPTALAAALVSFAVGMLTFDAFAFVQVTFLSFIMLGLGAAVVKHHEALRKRERRLARQAARPELRLATAAR